MMNSQSGLAALSTAELLARTRQLVEHSRRVEADLLVYLGEIDERRLYLERAFPSMFMFCVGEYGFSEEAAYNRIMVARAGRRLPAVIEALRTGEVHLGGLRLLVPHLTAENHRDVLAEAAGKTKRAIEELVARLAPQPPVLPSIRKLSAQTVEASPEPLPLALDHRPQERRSAESSLPSWRRSARRPSRSSSPRAVRCATSCARPRTCFATAFATETCRRLSRRHSISSSSR